MLLTTNDQILQWLDDHDGFANANLGYAFSALSKELSLQIEQRDKIALAGEPELVRLVSVIVSGVEMLTGDLTSEAGLDLYKMYPLPDRTGLILDVWGRDEVTFTCTGVRVVEIQETEKIAKPILSDSMLVFKVRIDEKPDAGYWVKRLRDRGYEVVYVGYFGDEMSTGQIHDYSGLHLIPKIVINRLSFGLKFCKVAHTNGILKIAIELVDSQARELLASLH